MNNFFCDLHERTQLPFAYALSTIGGKWKMWILYCINEMQPIRHNELQRKIGGITFKTLSVQLKQLEADGLIIRTEYPQIPPKVEYSLSSKGESLIPILDALCNWGAQNMEIPADASENVKRCWNQLDKEHDTLPDN